MGVQGKYVRTFKQANLATCVDISLDTHYPHYFFDVIAVTDDNVTLRSHGDGSEMTLPIVRTGKPIEFAWISQKPRMADVFGWPTEKFQIMPMQGKRF